MTTRDTEAFFTRLAALAELFDAKFSPAKAQLYFEALKDLAFDDVVTALSLAAKTCTFMPKPAELRKLAVGDDDDVTERAWLAFKAAVRSIGQYNSLATADAALGESILAMFGTWPAACVADLSPEMWTAKRKEFSRVYSVQRRRVLTGARYLLGVCEQQNAGRADYERFISVGVIERDGTLRELRGDQAHAYRAELAAQSHELRHLTDGVTLPARLAETA
jgi:hypothetical protein